MLLNLCDEVFFDGIKCSRLPAAAPGGWRRSRHPSEGIRCPSVREKGAKQLSDPQNFDEFYNGDRAFILGGQTHHWRPMHWREWGEIIDRRAADEAAEAVERDAKIAALVKEGKPQDEAEDIVDDEGTLVESFENVVDRIVVYLEPGDIPGFRAVLEDRDKRISVAQLQALMVWLQGVQTPDRPMETLSSSSSGPGTQGATSPAA